MIDEAGIARELDGDAAIVVDLLGECFDKRPFWLAADLSATFAACGIDLHAWRNHPRVKAAMTSFVYRGDWCPDGIAVCKAPEPPALSYEPDEAFEQYVVS